MKTIAVVVITMVGTIFADPDVTQENLLEWLSNSTGFEKNLGQITDFDKKPVENLFSRLNLKHLSISITAEGVSFVIYQTEKIKMRISSTTPTLTLNRLRETSGKRISSMRMNSTDTQTIPLLSGWDSFCEIVPQGENKGALSRD